MNVAGFFFLILRHTHRSKDRKKKKANRPDSKPNDYLERDSRREGTMDESEDLERSVS